MRICFISSMLNNEENTMIRLKGSFSLQGGWAKDCELDQEETSSIEMFKFA